MAINEYELEEAKMEIGKIIKDLNSSTACFTGIGARSSRGGLTKKMYGVRL